MFARGKKTGLVLGNVALDGKALATAGRIAAKTGAVLLSETFPSFHMSRGEGRPPVDLIPYAYEICVKFLESFEQLIFVGALFPVATFAYKNRPTMKSLRVASSSPWPPSMRTSMRRSGRLPRRQTPAAQPRPASLAQTLAGC